MFGCNIIVIVCQDPRDAPPPTRAETRDERLERKVRKPYLCFEIIWGKDWLFCNGVK